MQTSRHLTPQASSPASSLQTSQRRNASTQCIVQRQAPPTLPSAAIYLLRSTHTASRMFLPNRKLRKQQHVAYKSQLRYLSLHTQHPAPCKGSFAVALAAYQCLGHLSSGHHKLLIHHQYPTPQKQSFNIPTQHSAQRLLTTNPRPSLTPIPCSSPPSHRI